MATITIRVEDALRDALITRADAEGVTLSEYVRDVLLEDVSPVREVDSNGYRPETLTPTQRQTFALLHRILARVLPPDSNDIDGSTDDQLDLAATLEHGHTAEYWRTFAGIEPELSRRESSRVMDILDMFRIIDHSQQKLERDGLAVDAELAEALQFRDSTSTMISKAAWRTTWRT